MRDKRLHSLELLPDGQKIGDINPAFANLKGEIRVGNSATRCASCRKPFTAARKKRKEIRLWPVDLSVPVAWAYPICGACVSLFQKSSGGKDAVLASVEAFHYGEDPSQ